MVVVSGQPATGKSTLADRLGVDLGVPVLHRDRLRRSVFEGFVDVAPEAVELIPSAVTRLVLDVLDLILRAGGGAVIDGNFNTPEHADGLAELLAERGARAVEVCLWGDPDVLRSRFVARAVPPLTEDLQPYFERVLRRPRHPALNGTEWVVDFDTTTFDPLDEGYPALLARLGALDPMRSRKLSQ